MKNVSVKLFMVLLIALTFSFTIERSTAISKHSMAHPAKLAPMQIGCVSMQAYRPPADCLGCCTGELRTKVTNNCQYRVDVIIEFLGDDGRWGGGGLVCLAPGVTKANADGTPNACDAQNAKITSVKAVDRCY